MVCRIGCERHLPAKPGDSNGQRGEPIPATLRSMSMRLAAAALVLLALSGCTDAQPPAAGRASPTASSAPVCHPTQRCPAPRPPHFKAVVTADGAELPQTWPQRPKLSKTRAYDLQVTLSFDDPSLIRRYWIHDAQDRLGVGPDGLPYGHVLASGDRLGANEQIQMKWTPPAGQSFIAVTFTTRDGAGVTDDLVRVVGI